MNDRAATTSADTGGKMIWAVLLHLSRNLWYDPVAPKSSEAYAEINPRHMYQPYLQFDDSLWDDLLRKAVDAGLTMIIIDLGDGVRYRSHPEIAVENAFSVDRLKDELRKIRELGLEPIPKLNFSASHDVWLGPYARCVSTDAYYAVCKDLIAEVIDLFDTPRFFHLGMDEETWHHQRNHEYVVIRQYDLWWHDLRFYLEQVEGKGVRPWVWSDYVWEHPRAFFENMPRSVMQSNWYYGRPFRKSNVRVRAYLDLEEHGYDQLPTGSNTSDVENFAKTVAYGRRNIAPERLLGFVQAPWRPTTEPYRDYHMEGLEAVGRARAIWEARR